MNPSQLGYDYTENEDTSGKLTFRLTEDLVPEAAKETIAFTTQWQKSGAGRSDLLVEEGDGKGTKAAECWDAANNGGSASTCPVF